MLSSHDLWALIDNHTPIVKIRTVYLLLKFVANSDVAYTIVYYVILIIFLCYCCLISTYLEIYISAIYFDSFCTYR